MKLTRIHNTESSQVLQREREKDVGGLLQLFATMIGFIDMLNEHCSPFMFVFVLFNVLHVNLCTSVHYHQFTIVNLLALFVCFVVHNYARPALHAP